MNNYFDMMKNNNLDDGALKNGEEGLLELSPSASVGFDPFARYSVVVATDLDLFARYWLPLTLGQELSGKNAREEEEDIVVFEPFPALTS